MSVKILKSSTGNAIEIPGLGMEVPVAGVTINPSEYELVANEISEGAGNILFDSVFDGDIIVNDGVRDITLINDGTSFKFIALSYLTTNGDAWGQRFETSPERNNGFPTNTRNQQEAIEFAKSGAIDNDLDKFGFGRGGAIQNEILRSFDNLPGDDTPEPLAFDQIIRRVSWSNSRDNIGEGRITLWKYVHGGNPDRVQLHQFTFDTRIGYYPLDTDNPSELSIPLLKGEGIYVQAETIQNPLVRDIKVLVWTRKT